ncbi:MAG: hypothetical protein Q4G16_02950 [Cruoricaptor ignavus]|nr:hypothetical protein [Cruoricaptor ignavus]
MNKTKLVEIVKTKITEKINYLEHLIAETRASNNDTKSSMGDKYETSREMLQQEINHLQNQLAEVRKQELISKKLCDQQNQTCDFGAIVETDKALLYLSTPIGEIYHEERKIITISQESPLAKAMKGKSQNQTFEINGQTHFIKNIW